MRTRTIAAVVLTAPSGARPVTRPAAGDGPVAGPVALPPAPDAAAASGGCLNRARSAAVIGHGAVDEGRIAAAIRVTRARASVGDDASDAESLRGLLLRPSTFGAWEARR
jgi:hypothetical protein